MARKLDISVESFPMTGAFTISRGTKTAADVVTAIITDGHHVGRGECVPYKRYGESIQGVVDLIGSMATVIAAGMDRSGLQTAMKPGAARNALDCALWDLAAKQTGRRVAEMLDAPSPKALTTAYTISLGDSEKMESDARTWSHRALLKVKIGTSDDASRIMAVRKGAPESEIILDANEGWTDDNLAYHLEHARQAGISLIEQPLPAGKDGLLGKIDRKIVICADESVHSTADLAALGDRYDAINIKLDKTGGLTEATRMKAEAERLGLKIMVGCMVGTSLAMAPAVLLAQGVNWVDLDGPLLLAKDRAPALVYRDSLVLPPEPELWG